MSGRPWIEFPNGKDGSPRETLEQICRALWDPELQSKHAEIEGQGAGATEDSYVVRHVKVFNLVVFSGTEISESTIANIQRRGVTSVMLLANRKGLDLTIVTPAQAAEAVDELFRGHFGLKPYNAQGHYNVAAYWMP